MWEIKSDHRLSMRKKLANDPEAWPRTKRAVSSREVASCF